MGVRHLDFTLFLRKTLSMGHNDILRQPLLGNCEALKAEQTKGYDKSFHEYLLLEVDEFTLPFKTYEVIDEELKKKF